MIIKTIDKFNYIIRIIDKELLIKDIYNKEEIELLIKNITAKLKTKVLKGTLIFNIYIDSYNDLIIKIYNAFAKENSNYLNIKICFHLNNIFLYKIDYFDAKNLNINNANIYYYRDNFYLKPNEKIENYDLIELSEMIYDNDSRDVINDGILIT